MKYVRVRRRQMYPYKLQSGKNAIKPYLQECNFTGVHIPETYLYESWHRMSSLLMSGLPPKFVIKPERYHGGRGIVILERKSDGLYYEPDGKPWTGEEFSTWYKNDIQNTMLVFEECIEPHPDLKKISTYGMMPDFRFYFFRGTYAFSEVRIPTKKSRGYGNGARGGVLVFINEQGKIYGSPMLKNPSTIHPEYGDLDGYQIPLWEETLKNLGRIPAAFDNQPQITVDGTIMPDGKFAILEMHIKTALEGFLSEQGRRWFNHLCRVERQ